MKNKKIIVSMVVGVAALVMVMVIGVNRAGSKQVAPPTEGETLVFVDDMQFESANLPTATITVQGYGDMVAELYPELAPNTVNNFISLATSGFYNGLTIHRVVEDFVIQGGDPVGNGTGGPGYSIKGEFATNGYTDNILSHKTGVLSMARRMDGPDTAGSQFFIVTGDDKASSLDGGYAAFGKVIEGFDVLEQLNKVSVASAQTGQPSETLVIERITIDTKGQTYTEPEVINAQ